MSPLGAAATRVGGGATEPLLAIVVVNWNRCADLLECLQSLDASPYGRRQIIVVDNASSDGSREAVAAAFPDVLVVRSATNIGLSANNLGIDAAIRQGADYVLLLNNDTQVAAECLPRLVAAAEAHPRAGILGPRICYAATPDVVWYDGGVLRTGPGPWQQSHANQRALAAELPLEPRRVDYVCGCAMLVRRAVIEAIGGIDERFFGYWEDVDFSLRASRGGFDLLHVPAAVVFHKVSASFGGASLSSLYYQTRNQCFVEEATLSPVARLLHRLRYLRSCYWEYAQFARTQDADRAATIGHAMWDLLARHYGIRGSGPPALFAKALARYCAWRSR